MQRETYIRHKHMHISASFIYIFDYCYKLLFFPISTIGRNQPKNLEVSWQSYSEHHGSGHPRVNKVMMEHLKWQTDCLFYSQSYLTSSPNGGHIVLKCQKLFCGASIKLFQHFAAALIHWQHILETFDSCFNSPFSIVVYFLPLSGLWNKLAREWYVTHWSESVSFSPSLRMPRTVIAVFRLVVGDCGRAPVKGKVDVGGSLLQGYNVICLASDNRSHADKMFLPYTYSLRVNINTLIGFHQGLSTLNWE